MVWGCWENNNNYADLIEEILEKGQMQSALKVYLPCLLYVSDAL